MPNGLFVRKRKLVSFANANNKLKVKSVQMRCRAKN